VTRDRDWVFALHGWTVWNDVAPGRSVPFYLLPSLGGNNSLRSYAEYRFHDLNMAVVNVESRWALFTHVDVAAFVDAGNVAARFQDLNLAKRSYGGGVRLHTDRATFARVDVAYGAEGWKAVFRTNDPLRFSRLTRRVAAVPFVD
jgi:outer membrane protein assembly factor BamA